MTSVVRAPSQIPASGTYRTTADMSSSGAYDLSGNEVIAFAGPATVGTLLYDMGKTFYVTSAGLTTRVLRKVQVAPFESNNAFVDFYIQIGGSTGVISPVARL